jgi:hypothetical protein
VLVQGHGREGACNEWKSISNCVSQFMACMQARLPGRTWYVHTYTSTHTQIHTHAHTHTHECLCEACNAVHKTAVTHPNKQAHHITALHITSPHNSCKTQPSLAVVYCDEEQTRLQPGMHVVHSLKHEPANQRQQFNVCCFKTCSKFVRVLPDVDCCAVSPQHR